MRTEEIKSAVIFQGMTDEELYAALKELRASEKKYKKGGVILRASETTSQMCMVLDGSVTIESNDLWGNRTILSHVSKGQFFAETYALLSDEPMLVDATANEDCRVLFLRIGSLRELRSLPSSWKAKLTANLLAISANKNLHLSGRSFHTSPKTIRGRVMSYLNTVSIQKKTNEFDSPFDRQQLADYLNLERTALSKELGKMQKDGLIKVHRRHFAIIKHEE